MWVGEKDPVIKTQRQDLPGRFSTMTPSLLYVPFVLFCPESLLFFVLFSILSLLIFQISQLSNALSHSLSFVLYSSFNSSFLCLWATPSDTKMTFLCCQGHSWLWTLESFTKGLKDHMKCQGSSGQANTTLCPITRAHSMSVLEHVLQVCCGPMLFCQFIQPTWLIHPTQPPKTLSGPGPQM